MESVNTIRKPSYSSKQIFSIFRIEPYIKFRKILYALEKKGEIPKAYRVFSEKGKKQKIRKWTIDQLPKIGKRLGFLPVYPTKQQIVSIFTQKGGTLKSTISHVIARTLALHGIRVLVIGLDIQASITYSLFPLPLEIDSLEKLLDYNKKIRGLYFFFSKPKKDRKIDSIIYKTDLPNLDIIPETSELKDLALLFYQKTLREFRFKDELIPYLPNYDVILFDNGPNWNGLVENSLTCATILIQPIACDVGTFQVLDSNIAQVEEFRKKTRITWKKHLLLPTLKENTKLSQQILEAYTAQYPSHRLLKYYIRRSIVGQEAVYLNKSPLEHLPRADLAQDYFNVIKEIWEQIANEFN